MSTIELQNLTIGYSEKGNSKTVASNINATLRSGCLTCLVGSNGIGKSTLLRTLSAFQPMLSGNIVVDGRPLSDFSDKELSHVIGIVLTGKPDVQNMTVEELVDTVVAKILKHLGAGSAADCAGIVKPWEGNVAAGNQ